MMIILAPQYINMQRYPCRLAEALEAMMNHLAGQRSYHGILEAEVAHEKRA